MYFIIAITASIVGSISGIGGGIIIKPVMDAVSEFSTSTISFMSGCTVLTMSLSTLIRNRKGGAKLEYPVGLFLALGAAVGGYLGKTIFTSATGNIKAIQAALLLFINIMVYIYIRNKDKINTYKIKSFLPCISIGLLLGMSSAFLGIGGGPINIAVLYFFFSMSPKVTAVNSLFIILLSQFTSLLTTVLTNTVPMYRMADIVIMCIGGVLGAIVGSEISQKLSENKVERFFIMVLLLSTLLNIYNLITALTFY